MTSISITPGLVAARPATRLRLTTRGRRVMATLAALPVLVALAVAAVNGVSAVASSDVAASVEFQTITVLPGDTLWSLAAVIAPEADPREFVAEVTRLNLIAGGEIFAGQSLAIPLHYSN